VQRRVDQRQRLIVENLFLRLPRLNEGKAEARAHIRHVDPFAFN
jgi:hypothetical protein